MSLGMTIFGPLIALIGLFLPPIEALLPKISVIFYYKQLLIRRCFYLGGAVVIIISMLLRFDTLLLIALVILCVIILLGEFVMVPTKIIPPLDRPVSKSLQPGDLSEDTLVIGVKIGGLFRAYPLAILIPHHIVNDRIGETPVAATYCPACRSGYIYNPVVKGKRLTFEPVTVRRRNMVMKDRETGTVWQHETGTGLMGEFIGEKLEEINSEMCNWKTWIAEHPDTSVCFRPADYKNPSPMSHVFEKLLDHGPEHIVGRGINGIDDRLPQHDFIIGLMVDGIPRAYPLSRLVEKKTISDNIGGVPIMLIYEEGANRVKAFRLPKGQESQTALEGGRVRITEEVIMRSEKIPFVRQWWLAWSEYHPNSELFEE